MRRGDKSKYTAKQAHKADDIAQGYEARGISEREAEHRAWATVNSDDGRGKKSGSGRSVETGDRSAHMGGITGGEAASARPAAKRAREATVTSEHNEHHAQS